MVPDVRETLRKSDGIAPQSSQEIPSGDPIILPYNGSKRLPVARLLYEEKPTGAPEVVAGDGGSDDNLVDEIMAYPPPCQYNHDEDLEEAPQLTLGNLKKFQADMRECSRFAVVSTESSTSLLLYVVNLKLIANCCAANGQSLISEVTEVKGDGCRSSKDQFAREGECHPRKG